MHFDRSSQAFKRAAAMARRLGLRFHVGRNPFYVRGKGHGVEDTSDLTHEIGHFLVSPARLRRRMYYGLGLEAFGLGKPKPALSDNRIVELEEEASMLGIALYYLFTESKPGAVLIAFEHGWYNSGRYRRDTVLPPEYQETLSRLEAKGLMPPRRREALKKVFGPLG